MPPYKLEYPVSVAILFAGGESEDDKDSVVMANNISDALERRGHVVRMFEVNSRNRKSALKVPGDVVFNLAEDDSYGWRLYMNLASDLEDIGRGMVGLKRASFPYVIRKASIKRKFYNEGISTPNFRIFNRRSDVRSIKGLEYPLIVKPSMGHAAIGITQDSVVIDQSELEERVKYLFDNMPGEVLIEEYIEGREIHVTVLGNGSKATVLPYAELAFSGEYSDNWSVYSYNAKWNKSSWEYWNLPVVAAEKISRKLDSKIERLVLSAYKSLNCCDVARFDLRIDDRDHPYILDANMAPSLENNSGDSTWVSAARIKWSYDDLIETIVSVAYKRQYGKYPKRLRERSLMLNAA